MRKVWIGLLTGILVFLLSGFSSAQEALDLDLKNYIQTDQAMNAKYSDLFMSNFQKKASLARTPEEFSEVVAELKEVLVDIQGQYGALKPESKEMKPLVKEVNVSISLMIEAVDDLDQAVAEKNQDLMMSAVDKMNKAVVDLNSAETEIVRLANEKGVKVQQRK